MSEIIKVCRNCGDLTREQVIFRTRANRTETNCRICVNAQQKKSATKHKEKRKLYRDMKRYIDRPTDIKELSCSKCRETKSVLEFNRHMLNIRYPYCRSCRISATKNYRDKDGSKKHKKWYQDKYEPIARNSYYLKNYGITLDQYNEMSEQQNHLCLICKKLETVQKRSDGKAYLSVDHCHSTKNVRGLLCSRCNQGIGLFFESTEILLSAIEYLASFS